MKEIRVYDLISHYILNYDLTPTELKVLALVNCFPKSCYMRAEEMGRQIKKSRRSIFNALKSLQEKNVISKSSIGYHINRPNDISSSSSIYQEKSADSCTDSAENCTKSAEICTNGSAEICTDYIYKKDLYITPSDEGESGRGKKKLIPYSKGAISKDDRWNILLRPDLGNGDKDYVLECEEEMADWALSNAKRKQDWPATLRNWIRRKWKAGERPRDMLDEARERYQRINSRLNSSEVAQ